MTGGGRREGDTATPRRSAGTSFPRAKQRVSYDVFPLSPRLRSRDRTWAEADNDAGRGRSRADLATRLTGVLDGCTQSLKTAAINFASAWGTASSSIIGRV